MNHNVLNGNAIWLRERALAIQSGDRPATEEEWFALATGMEMIAADWERTQAMILDAITQGAQQ